MHVFGMIKTIVLRDVNTTMVGAVLTIPGLCQVQMEIRNIRAGFSMEVFILSHITRDIIRKPISKTIYTYGLLPFIRLKIYISGSFYDQCIAKNGLHYIRDGGEDGCYYFHSLSFSMEYDYNKSKEFCENISDANGSLPIVKGPKDNNNMLHLLNGYVCSLYNN